MDAKSKIEIGGLLTSGDATIADLVVRMPAARRALEILGIDYCCGGNKLLSEALAERNIEIDALVQAIEEASNAVHPREDRDWSTASVTELADHILSTHHVFMKRELPRIAALLRKVTTVHAGRHGEMLRQLNEIFQGLRSEIEQHLAKEEEILFPIIVKTDAFLAGKGERPVSHCGSVSNPIRQMELEHENAGEALVGIRTVTDNFTLPDDGCPTLATLWEALESMEKDLHEHIHLENNILFPGAVALETTMAGA